MGVNIEMPIPITSPSAKLPFVIDFPISSNLIILTSDVKNYISWWKNIFIIIYNNLRRVR
ncbi:hypothetical protein MCHI_001587 [Candidatus Magnetoovum chiemensis]|nr:hypothetical protein MCHI_001587 [Candidatus Magnetoovum chiemensis]